MDWHSVRKQYPNRWVLIEALNTDSKNRRRFIVEMSVISDFNDTKQAWQAYKKHHLNDPSREYYIFHTSNRDIEIIEQPFSGVRIST